jgi:hypothetical protein
VQSKIKRCMTTYNSVCNPNCQSSSVVSGSLWLAETISVHDSSFEAKRLNAGDSEKSGNSKGGKTHVVIIINDK